MLFTVFRKERSNDFATVFYPLCRILLCLRIFISLFVMNAMASIVVEYAYENSNECTTITSYDDQGHILWQKEYAFPAGQFRSVDSIGENEGKYYFRAGQDLIMVDVSSGEEIWKVSGIGTVTESGTLWDRDGNLYITCYMRPDLTVISSEGEVLYQIPKVRDEIYWSSDIWLEEDGTVVIYYENLSGEYSEIEYGSFGTVRLNPSKISADITSILENGLPADCFTVESFGNSIYQKYTDRSFSWQFFENGTLYIYGNGNIPDYSSERRAPWYNRFFPEIKKIYVSQSIKRIGDWAFTGLDQAEVIYLPQRDIEIGEKSLDTGNDGVRVVN